MYGLSLSPARFRKVGDSVPGAIASIACVSLAAGVATPSPRLAAAAAAALACCCNCADIILTCGVVVSFAREAGLPGAAIRIVRD